MVSREEEPPHTSHHGAREISFCKNKEYKKEKIIYMNERDKEIERKRETGWERSKKRDRSLRKRERVREKETWMGERER